MGPQLKFLNCVFNGKMLAGTKSPESEFLTRCSKSIKKCKNVKGILTLKQPGQTLCCFWGKKKKKLHSLLFVLPFAMHALILAGMSPVVDSSGPEEQNSRWNWTLRGLVPPHGYSSSSTVQFKQTLCYTTAQNVQEIDILCYLGSRNVLFWKNKQKKYKSNQMH